jgi:hypothetical protein
MGEHSFPTTREGLHTHFSVAVPWVISQKVRHGTDATKITNMNDTYGDGTTPDTYIYLYNTWADPTTCNSVATEKLDKIEVKLKDILRNIYDNIPADKWNDDDRAKFNRKTGLPRATPVHHKEKIKDEMFFDLEARKNGEFDFRCRPKTDSKRAHLPEGADGVEIIYDIKAYTREPGETEGLPGWKKLPTNISECPFSKEFHQATFTLKIDPTNVGKYIVLYARWINSKHPEAAGDFYGPLAEDVR